ncbi:MAG TPA: hypothetical protein VH619_04960 [Verrucomicrobiae bacterium]|nr:hypothetical protein [Verrucomicrobiae bacterium]
MSVLLLLMNCFFGKAENYWEDGSFESGSLAACSQSTWSGTGNVSLATNDSLYGEAALLIGGTNAQITVWQTWTVAYSGIYHLSASFKLLPGFTTQGGTTGFEVKTNLSHAGEALVQVTNQQWQTIGWSGELYAGQSLQLVISFGMYGAATGQMLVDGTSIYEDTPPDFAASHSLSIDGSGLRTRQFTIDGLPGRLKAQAIPLTLGSPQFFAEALSNDVNCVYLPWYVNSQDIFQILCCTAAENGLGVIAEYNPSFWEENWISNNPSLAMAFSPSHSLYASSTDYPTNYVQWFPDYLNSDFMTLLKQDVRTALDDILPFYHRPVIAISLGAYDYWHVPDGELHPPEFNAGPYPHPLGEGHQLWLPYNSTVLAGYKSWLQSNDYSLNSIGFTNWEDVFLPDDNITSARTTTHWESFVRYRRSIVTNCIASLVSCIKSETDLPLGITWDLDFSLQEDYAPDTAGICKLVNLLFCYFYNPPAQVSATNWIRAMLEFNNWTASENKTALIAFDTFPATGYTNCDLLAAASLSASGVAYNFSPGSSADNFWSQAQPFFENIPTSTAMPLDDRAGFYVGDTAVFHWQSSFNEYLELATNSVFPAVQLSGDGLEFSNTVYVAQAAFPWMSTNTAFQSELQSGDVTLLTNLWASNNVYRIPNYVLAFSPELLSVPNSTTLQISSVPGRTYQLEGSTNLQDWQALGNSFQGNVISNIPLLSTQSALFYRLQRLSN